MKIGIDASRAFGGMRTGTEEYSFELVRALAASELSSDSEVILFAKRGAGIGFELPSNFSIREIGGDFLWTQLHLSWELLRHPVDVLFVPAHTVPFIHPQQTVATVHGLEFRRCRDCYPWRQRLIMEINTRLALRFASRIIVPSESTRRDIIEAYGMAGPEVRVIPHGAPAIRPAGKRPEDAIFTVLFVGRMERRKNVSRMVRAFDRFRDALGQGDGEARLVLAGADGFGAGEIAEEISRCRHRQDIVCKGYVSEAEKIRLYEEADVFLFPTRAEGFGLPVLEAMSCGVPVIASRGGAAEEVSGGAAMLVDPEDEEEIARSLSELFRDPGRRENLVRKGYENLEGFSWSRCAEETWKALEK